jgi:SNF2 family DNA or RNA helicase
MKEISAKGTMHYGFQSRVLMSGTPLQNDLTELWTCKWIANEHRILGPFLVPHSNLMFFLMQC